MTPSGLSPSDMSLVQVAAALARNVAQRANPASPSGPPAAPAPNPLDPTGIGDAVTALDPSGIPAASDAATAALPNDAQKNRFFNVLDSGLTDLATSLGLPREYLQGLAAYESEYYNDHNRDLANPLGLTHAGKDNLAFSSIDDALAYWRRLYGPQVQGATSPEDFAQRLLGMRRGASVPGWNRYNSVEAAWAANLVKTINSIDRHRQTWNNQQNFDQ